MVVEKIGMTEERGRVRGRRGHGTSVQSALRSNNKHSSIFNGYWENSILSILLDKEKVIGT